MLFYSVLLQADTLQATTAAAAPEKISLFFLLKEGGFLMIPLLLCSLLMLYVFLDRFMFLRKISKTDNSLVARIKEQILSGNLQAAKSICRGSDSPVGRMLEKGINRIGRPVDVIEKAMENTGKLEVYAMEKNLSILSTIARIAPMFGFLGTIAGMILLFFNIQHQGFSLEGIAGGIYTKMVTSAVGLIIGLLSYVGYDYLNAQINKMVNKMESASAEFLDVLQEPAQ